MFLLRDNEKKVVFVVWRFHVCPNDWQLNQFHINPKREMHNLSTSASKTTISFKLCSRVFNWILFSWIFFNRIFCSPSDRINLWGRTNRWSRSDKIYPTSSLSPIADMKHVRAPHETAGLKTSRLKLSLLHNSWIGDKEPMEAAKSIWISLSNVWSASNRQAPCINKINWSRQILD